ncbi:TrmH family RNA methyltransferase [Christiangramia forsetii]|uniref:TrmH family tRNA/rRNA methyltransferase n=2 Tax=Christiangramia forsetii TaxID=411153 RepID=A0LZG1_CHRFK|nr:RNA methyltransferase [Christiangramia forsetii]GGG38223.1 rRNA methyltransferase [Christiangramia forsetii]CAL65756.1 TrmH family tRNA/rRNA methyltransferase [Christiangramia forsetii KT0803]
MLKKITSQQNKEIKWLLQLQEKSRNRRKENSFIVEGKREVNLALKGGYLPLHLYFVPELIDFQEVLEMAKANEHEAAEITEINKEVYDKIAYRGSTEGLLAVFRNIEHPVENLSFEHPFPLILVAEAPEKPGNIGAILRTADAAAVDAVIIANPKTDLYNPNIIRSSVGSLFTNKIATGTTSEIIQFLQAQKIHIYAAALQASKPYSDINFKEASAIIMGTEATGLSNEWLENSTQNIIIPMHGKIDSMNVSVAAGILIFEAKRQRLVENSLH